MTELELTLFEQSGVLTTGQAAALTSPAKLRHRLATGRWSRVCRGVIVTHTGELTRDQQLWVAVLAAGPNALLGGLTAATESGLRGSPAEPLYVLLPASRTAPDLRRRLPPGMPGVVVKRTTVLPDGHVQVGRPMRTTTPRAVIDAAQWARGEEPARAVIAAACQQRLVTPEELLDVLRVLPRAHRRHLIRTTIDDVAGGAQALAEIDLVRLCRRFDLPAPELQERRKDASGRFRYLDAYWRRWHLHVEVDGAHHMEAGQWEADMRRQNDIWVRGDRILRFPAFLVRCRPAEVADQLRRALLAAGWRP